jgi:hypothetical protein
MVARPINPDLDSGAAILIVSKDQCHLRHRKPAGRAPTPALIPDR